MALTYKQAYDLTLVDLQKYPVWAYILEDIGLPGQDERTVTPYLSFSPDPSHRMLIVRTTFIFVNGCNFKGIIKPVRLNRHPRWGDPLIPVDHSPVIVTERGQVIFHYGTRKPDEEEISHDYVLLGFTSKEIFPINYTSDIQIKDCILDGVINGFMYFDEAKKGFENIIRLKPSDIQVVV